MNLRSLRSYIKEVLIKEFDLVNLGKLENPLRNGRNDKEMIGKLRHGKPDEELEIADHLREPEVDPEDCRGPIPPVPEPGVYADPFAQDVFPEPNRQPQIGKMR